MTSKISFFKLMKEDFKRRSWLVALIALMDFIVLPVSLMIKVEGMMASIEDGYTDISYVIQQYKGYMGADNQLAVLIVIMTALLTGISGYAYLHSRTKLDFYHSLPIRRKKFFFVQYLSGIIMFVIPYIVSILLCLLIGAVNGLLTGDIMVITVQMTLLRLLEYLAAYGTAILAVVLTGKVLIAILGAATIIGYFPVVIAICQALNTIFFDTYVTNGRFSTYCNLFSPVLAGVFAEDRIASGNYTGKWLLIGMGILILWGLLLTVLAIWLYGIRKTEAAEHSMAFPKTESVIKVLLVIPLSLVSGLYLQGMLYKNSTLWFFVGIVSAVVIFSAVIEFIYHLNMKEIFHHKLQMLLAGVLSLAIALVFRFDVTGYDTYLPAKEKVAQMALYSDEENGGFFYHVNEKGFICNSAVDALDETLLDAFDDIYELAAKGAREKVSDDEDTRTVYVEYKLKSGRREYRRYDIKEEDVEAAYQSLYGDPAFIRKIYPVFSREMDTAADLKVYGRTGTYPLELGREKRERFFQIYKQDLEQISYEDLIGHTVGNLSFSTEVNVERELYGTVVTSLPEEDYPICDSFSNTLAFLKEEMGIDLSRELTAEDVENIQIADYRDEKETGLYRTVTDPEEIQEILDCMYYTVLRRYQRETEHIDLTVILKGGEYLPGTYCFEKGKVPAFLDSANE